jgi:hypothetical protein
MKTSKFDQKVYDTLSMFKPETAELYKASHKPIEEIAYDYFSDTSSNYIDLPKEWRERMFARYTIHIVKDGYVIESYHMPKTWTFNTLAEAETKIKQLVVWLYGERKRGIGNIEEDMKA